MDLYSLASAVFQRTEGIITLLTHVQAGADAAEVGNVMETDPIASLPAAGLYITEPWTKLLRAIRQASFLPHVRDVRAEHDFVVREGEAALRDLWSRLGLTIEERPNREWALWVDAPRR